MDLEIERIDYKELPLTKFIQKYPKYTLYSAHKKFWDKDLQKNNILTEKQVRNKQAQDRLNKELIEEINKKNQEIKEKFYIYEEDIVNNEIPKDKVIVDKERETIESIIKKLLNCYTYTEILRWKVINWKLVVRDLFRVVRN